MRIAKSFSSSTISGRITRNWSRHGWRHAKIKSRSYAQFNRWNSAPPMQWHSGEKGRGHEQTSASNPKTQVSGLGIKLGTTPDKFNSGSKFKVLVEFKWRTERDSNPRYALTYTHFPGVRLQPLGHLSVLSIAPAVGSGGSETSACFLLKPVRQRPNRGVRQGKPADRRDIYR